MTPERESQDEMPIVEYEVSGAEFPRLARDLPDGTPVEPEYDSAYGGKQVVRDELEHIERRERMTAGEAWERGAARPGEIKVGDRIIDHKYVRSGRDRRRIGRPEFARVQIPRDRAIDHLTRDVRYDVDPHGDEATIVQFWDAEYGGEATLPHLEDGEPVNPAYEPRNTRARDSWMHLGP